MLRCLLYIDGNAPVLRKDIYRDVAAGAGMMANISNLKDLGLIDFYESTVKGREMIVLTERGKSTVTALRLMLGIASEEIPTR
ncbi:MAG: hypothetical protein IKQ67_02875 [Candidatus Methanomethylophilaceae archaeon]|nr:hypothetical protein [Candidatus Methanomethylophilaceae archaeon]